MDSTKTFQFLAGADPVLQAMYRIKKLKTRLRSNKRAEEP
jgi:hypothetical protein